MFDKSISGMGKGNSSLVKNAEKIEVSHNDYHIRGAMPGSELWTNGLICAFEYIGRHRKPINKPRSHSKTHKHDKPEGDKTIKTSAKAKGNNLVHATSLMELGAAGPSNNIDTDTRISQSDHFTSVESHVGSRWVPIGWARIGELVQTVNVDASWASQQIDMDDEDGLTVAELAAPYWERLGGPIWWCHVAAGHPAIDAWLGKAQWLHPAVSIALRDESRLISEWMKHLLYEVPVRVAGGLLFELLGQSAGDPFVDEDDIPVVLRSWQAQNFLVTALHVKGTAARINVLGIAEVEELLFAGGTNTPRTVHEVIAHLATRLARWDDRLFRKTIFGAADEVELKFVNRRNHEDTNLFSIILNQEITKLSRQVIRVKWSLHAREEIVFELLQHLRGNAKSMLEGIRKSTRDMIDEQEAVRGRLFTIQDVMQSTVRAWLQDKSLRVTHNLAVFGGCGLVLTIITGLFGINVDGIPGAQNMPYAFAIFSAIVLVLALVLIAVGLLYLGLKQPVSEEQVEVRKLELQQLVKMFQHEAETHAQVSKKVSRHNLPPTAADMFSNEADYILIH